MPKNTRTLLIIAAVAVAAYLGYRLYEKRKANAGTNSPTGALGTNLNSVAPELVGGSTGPSVGPALSSPVTINLTENVAPTPVDQGGPMIPANNQTQTGSLTGGSSPSTGAAGSSSQPDTSPAIGNPGGPDETGVPAQPGGPVTTTNPGGPVVMGGIAGAKPVGKAPVAKRPPAKKKVVAKK
jgi:hypothetical protein